MKGEYSKSRKELKFIIEEVLDDLTSSKVSDRQVKFWRGCKTDGIREGFSHCGNETCTQCNHLHNVLKEHALETIGINRNEEM